MAPQLQIIISLFGCASVLAQAAPIPAPELVIDPVTGDVELSLPTELDIEYTLERSTALSGWTPIGETLLGNTLPRMIVQPAPVPARQFFRVQADTEFEIDATTFGYGEPGRTWVYEFTQTFQNDGTISRQDEYDETRVISGPVDRNGILSYDLTSFDESGAEVFVGYFAADFSEGIFAVGSRDPSGILEETFNEPPSPEITSTFTPGVEQESTSTNTFLGETTTVLKISIHPGSLTVPAGTFQEVIYVNSTTTAMTFVGPLEDVVQTWWVRGIGPIRIERDTTFNNAEEPSVIQRSMMISVTPG
ncbi:hypothetical protein OAF27_01570 [Verrucomicrobiales bacterium]|nr:hypothetical protein [Verrucomicrobiales bacterium]